MRFSNLQTNIPNHYPELKSCLLLWAGNSNFKLRIVIWNIFFWRFGDLTNTSHFSWTGRWKRIPKGVDETHLGQCRQNLMNIQLLDSTIQMWNLFCKSHFRHIQSLLNYCSCDKLELVTPSVWGCHFPKEVLLTFHLPARKKICFNLEFWND